jgi:hypothetical protein
MIAVGYLLREDGVGLTHENIVEAMSRELGLGGHEWEQSEHIESKTSLRALLWAGENVGIQELLGLGTAPRMMAEPYNNTVKPCDVKNDKSTLKTHVAGLSHMTQMKDLSKFQGGDILEMCACPSTKSMGGK